MACGFEGWWKLEGGDSRAVRKEGGKVRDDGVGEVVGSFMGVSSIVGDLGRLWW